MEKQTTREAVLERSRLADKARMDALKESDGAGDMVKTEEEEEEEEVEEEEEEEVELSEEEIEDNTSAQE